MVVTKPVTSSGQLRAGGRHRKQALHRKAVADQRFSGAKLIAVGAVAAVLVAVLAVAGLITKWATEDSVPVAGASQPPSPTERAAIPQPQAEVPRVESPVAFPSDDRGFVGSSARCQETKSAYAIGRTKGSLVVICAERTGRYEYLGVRLSDAAVLRTDAETNTAREFLAQKSGVVYAVSPTELKVTTGNTVIKQEPMLEYREVRR
jgi:hypothetical protein